MKKIENTFEQFSYLIMPLMIIFLGLVGNLLGLLTLSKNDQLDKEIGPINMYRYIFITDTILIFSFINVYIHKIYSIGFLSLSPVSCKLSFYLTFTFCSVSSFLLIYILVERYLSIKYPVESNLIRNNKIQFIYLITIVAINLIYFSPVFLYYNLVSQVEITNITNNSIKVIKCVIETDHKHKIEIITFINRIILPLFLILFFSVLLICSIYKSKSKMQTFYSQKERKIFKSDVYLSIISILFNLIQFSFNIPIVITYFVFHDEDSIIFFLGLNFLYLSYAFNFYFLISLNSLFRREFYLIFKKKPRLELLNVEMKAFF